MSYRRALEGGCSLAGVAVRRQVSPLAVAAATLALGWVPSGPGAVLPTPGGTTLPPRAVVYGADVRPRLGIDTIASAPSEPDGASPAVRFALRFKNVTWRHPVGFVGVLPGERLELQMSGGGLPDGFRVRTTRGPVDRTGPGEWRWTAPRRPGLYPLTILAPNGTDSITLNAFVMVPASEVRDEHLNGYRIGRYPARPLRDIYRPPAGYIEVTPDNQGTLVSPHFRMSQFLCKQPGGYPKYVVLDPALLVKLELILAAANAEGYRARTFFIMSGYRTPFYNRSIGNSPWSRHQWGAAADIYIDEMPADGVIDDLNDDGNIDIRDADLLGDIVERLSVTDEYRGLLGGMGRYRRTSTHGPFLHVDLRGRRARW